MPRPFFSTVIRVSPFFGYGPAMMEGLSGSASITVNMAVLSVQATRSLWDGIRPPSVAGTLPKLVLLLCLCSDNRIDAGCRIPCHHSPTLEQVIRQSTYRSEVAITSVETLSVETAEVEVEHNSVVGRLHGKAEHTGDTGPTPQSL